jgi:hypothetical protein
MLFEGGSKNRIRRLRQRRQGIRSGFPEGYLLIRSGQLHVGNLDEVSARSKVLGAAVVRIRNQADPGESIGLGGSTADG